MREKGWEERGLKAHSKRSDFPSDLGTLQCPSKCERERERKRVNPVSLQDFLEYKV